jgi:hypothetical protein
MGRSVGVLGIVFALMLSAGLWLAQSHGNPARSVEDAAFCAHVADLSTTLTEVRAGSPTAQSLVRLQTLGAGFERDATALSAAGEPVKATQATALAADLGDWRQAMAANDAVDEDIALNRVLSALPAAASC